MVQVDEVFGLFFVEVIVVVPYCRYYIVVFDVGL